MPLNNSTSNWQHGLAIAYQALLATLIVAACVVVYAHSPLREHIENRLFDIRTRLARTTVLTDDIAVITIGETDIQTLASVSPDGLVANLDYQGLARIIQAVRNSHAKNIAVLLHAQAFSYEDDSGLSELARLAAEDPRIVFGINRTVSGDTGFGSIPKPLRAVREQVGDMEATRTYRREIVREMKVDSRDSTPYLLQILAKRLGLNERLKELPHDAKGKRVMRLNYFDPGSILRIPAQAIVAGHGSDRLAGRTVFIGYTAFRPWSDALLDATHLHTPWESEAAEVDATSMPLVFWQAEALINLMRPIWLKHASTSTVTLQIILVTLVTLAFWLGSIGFACLLFIGGWAIFLIVNAYYFAAFSWYVPLADTLIASVGAMVCGATLRLRAEGKLRAAAEARAVGLAELANVQQRFLDRFTSELSQLNTKVRDLIQFSLPPESSPTVLTSHERLQQSCQEFDEYLAGLDQLRMLDHKLGHKPAFLPVNLDEAVKGLIQQFDTLQTSQTPRFALELASDKLALGDSYLVRQILYNLISNAIKYSPADGVVTIRIDDNGDRINVHVIDQGPGIAPEFHDRIFEKFYRVKNDYVYKIKGHGLGLYLCRFFAEQIDAIIRVHSSVGHGATFTLNLRTAKAKGRL